MQKLISRIALIALVVLLIVFFVFWGRISGSIDVYQLIGKITFHLTNGNDDLNYNLSAKWGQGEKLDSIDASVYYQKDTVFLSDIKYNEKQFIIRSNKENTTVNIIHQDLSITGEGKNFINFDLLRLGGEILDNHPELRSVLALSWIDKVGIAAWAFFNCDFNAIRADNVDYDMISLPRNLLGNNIDIWLDKDNNKKFRLLSGDSLQVLQVDLMINSNPEPDDYSSLDSKENLWVDRAELNRAIYRGSFRAVGILLEDAVYPTADGEEKTWGKGILTYVDSNRVFLASGSHREIGKAHGTLLKAEIRKMVDATLYTVGWVYTLDRGSWFIDDMRAAYNRLEPYIPEKYQEEMKGLSETSGITLEEVRLTNVFPALFHCSGFALFNKATLNGKLYHGRVLDYMTRIGLQYHAVVFVINPDGGYAHTNIGYAGFIGSVSGMNEHKVAFGEMGGRGEGDWDGMPMGFLMREGLERAETLDQALKIFENTPRTCEYYYVISDGKIPDARGLATDPKRFDIIEPNQFHELLQHPMEDAVLMSAGDRYEKLAERVKAKFGTINVREAIRLMDRPVAMKSNLHNVLFAPESLEFWVANAGAGTPACDESYSHYSLSELLSKIK